MSVNSPLTEEAQPQYKKRKRSPLPFVLAIVAVAAVAAVIVFALNFGKTPTQSETPGGANGTNGAGSEQSELTIGLIAEPQNLDIRNTAGVPLDQILIDNVYQGLVGLKPGSIDEIVPVLATDLPDISADGLTYTFTVRDDVTFHSGSKLTAEDVQTSLNDTLSEALLGSPMTVTAPDARTVVVALGSPNSLLLWHLANREGLILEAAADNNLANSANGTGPYLLDDWKQGDSLTLVKNDAYFGEEATMETVVFRFIPDGRAAVNALNEGELDVHTALLPTLRPEFENSEEFTLVRAASTDVFTLAFNSAKAPFDDPRVRQALSQAIDSAALIQALNGDGTALGGPITSREPGYADLTSVHPYDPDAARALLAEAGQTNLSITITAPNFYDQSTLDLITTQLTQVGISAQVNSVEFATWLEQVYTNHDFDLSYIDHAEARDFANYTNPGYYFGYDNPKVQELYAQAIETTDLTKADELIREAAQIVAEDAPAKWLYNYTPTNVISTHVHGFPSSNTNSRINLAEIRLAPSGE